jgi:hypothetical protein
MIQRIILSAGLLCAVCGCAAEEKPKNKWVETPAVLYEGLKGQGCAVMVWADWRTRTEYNQVQLDLGKVLTRKIDENLKPKKEGKKSEGPPVTFTNPASVVRYQREHPEVMSMPIAEVAPKLQASRVVYVEIEEFSAHSPEAVMVLKGNAKATLRVVEVNGAEARVVFEEPGIAAHFPPDRPEGVVESEKVNVRTIYEGTIDLLAEKLAARFSNPK